ncbi:DUF4267 domain-containing protein [Nocardioides mangrovicus]|uniref:DUF4267 domain-containing protein n=1 Tax=Nocardioides mangrovicus TaxID=2478913 RepID=A0A3L8NZY8_9ACTN|nr:DUF4267 domain-containing protein [Nocardioides mangrovicus]RLV48746.1 DUF4267 domain-containing protein [Nocardioides mangrovicus]
MRVSLDPVVGLSLGRIGVGVLALTRPEEAARRFRLAPGASAQLTYMTRLFGSREIALGVITLLATGKTRRRLVVAGIGIDVADGYAALMGAKDGSLDTTTGAVLTGPAVGGVLAGVGSLRRTRRREKESSSQESRH